MEAVIVRRTILLVLTMTLIAGGSLGKGKGSTSEFSGLEDLTKQEGLFEMTMIHTDADFSRYNKLFPRTVELEFRDQGRKESESVTGSMVGRRGSRKARPNRKDVAKFEQILNDAFADELGRSGAFQMVHEAGPDTLILRTTVMDIIAKFPSKSSRRADSEVQLLISGSIVFDLIDAETGVIQARIGERRRILQVEDSAENSDPAELWADVGEWAQRAAADLCLELERVWSGAAVDTDAAA